MQEIKGNICKKYELCLILKDGYELPVYEGINKNVTMPEIIAAASLISEKFEIDTLRLKITEYHLKDSEYQLVEEHYTDIVCK